MTIVRAIDYHTAGEPFRIVLDGMPEIKGTTVAERRIFAQNSTEIDAFRQLLCREPRGHADMYGGFIVPPDDDGADFGVLFWHGDGFSTACGHGTIALGVWAVTTGRVPAAAEGVTPVTIDVPSGRVVAHVRQTAGAVTGVVFENVPSYPVARDVVLQTSRGSVSVDLGFGGALYACVEASALGLSVEPEHYDALLGIGREIKWALNDIDLAQHPDDDRLSGIYGTIIFDDLGDTADGPHQRNVTVFADGRVDRSPCGSGTAVRLALLADSGRLGTGQTLTHDSIVGTRFLGRARPVDPAGKPGAIIPEVEGMAYKTGEHIFTLDQSDPVGTGLVLR
ncbi:proline racemase family protein [Cryobacterium sp. Hz9]|uniref:proline racemase family protein n=1 Tax=Cryobacterium sp. Hz9 TaxID=1259167 RepID=UPI00106AAA78|nr:proline racemase family protein [Cryobacterium sp. Hz9]TFB69174.1 proline racemase [Cryobacterium sp. Hz9]